MKEEFSKVTGFDWDTGNRDKNKLKHNVSTGEAEQLFFNEPLIILNDEKHSQNEIRYAAFGSTDQSRLLVVIFTIRKNKIRVISAHDMNRKERAFYEQ
jgi:uncharacterized DUF497 family protein